MLGAGEPERARIFSRIAYVLEIVWGVVNGGVGLLYRYQLFFPPFLLP